MKNQHYWTCVECKQNSMDPAPDDGSLTCGECSGEHKLRTIAVRLLNCPGSPHYVPHFSASSGSTGSEHHKRSAALVDALVAKLKSGEVPIPEVLPVPFRRSHDDGAGERVAVGIYRALGNGARRRWDTNASRR